MITFSKEVFKALFLINGGAIVALLGYLGQKTPLPHCISSFVWLSLVALTIGLIFAVVCYSFAYLTQFTLYNESIDSMHSGPSGTEGSVGTLHMIYFWRAVISAAVSIALFLLGAFLGIAAIVNA